MPTKNPNEKFYSSVPGEPTKYDHSILIIRNPTRSILMIIRDGVVTESTNQHYINKTCDFAISALSSTMRYWDERVKDNEYPETIEIPPKEPEGWLSIKLDLDILRIKEKELIERLSVLQSKCEHKNLPKHESVLEEYCDTCPDCGLEAYSYWD